MSRSTWELVGEEQLGRVLFLLYRCRLCKRRGCVLWGGEPSRCCCQDAKP